MTQTNGRIIVGIDHGYGNIKTANAIFPANVQRCTAEPAMAENKLFWAGEWFIVGEGHKEFTPDKCEDEDYLIMTMTAIAMELKLCNVTKASILLAVGLPLTWVGAQKESFRQYLTRYDTLEFHFNGVDYTVEIEDALVFVQDFAAVADRLGEFGGVNMLCDIGNGTMSIMYINNRRPVSGKCYTEKFGTYQCTLAVREAIMRSLHTVVDDSIIEFGLHPRLRGLQASRLRSATHCARRSVSLRETLFQVLRTGTADVSQRVLDIIRDTAREYVAGIMRCLREREYNPELMRLYLMGGGACLVRNFGEFDKERVKINDDIHATANEGFPQGNRGLSTSHSDSASPKPATRFSEGAGRKGHERLAAIKLARDDVK